MVSWIRSCEGRCHLEIHVTYAHTIFHQIGVAHFFIQHTSAALSINENQCDSELMFISLDLSSVRKDMDMALDHLVPESLKWKHTDEHFYTNHQREIEPGNLARHLPDRVQTHAS
ncbi:uncharacterized protein MELLADRAFT_93996 [Melampsora larici-populina 98AG31]|uniref:Uncharacterized protein n=1 Tax=Melampsora larici-populina (strain 98AG31 / pathotype 3-4-7) TaxID=747676 RepID=F4S613_MELLP|nr:uncharacterized protein MELLADRAFT_93996 [Melampsora larici-populina 98AG31]EGF99921.1 hypothetical protein MELLADRAFT_93996 [Melampsora larici-populina 98AG31]